jgi:hypothetical protein
VHADVEEADKGEQLAELERVLAVIGVQDEAADLGGAVVVEGELEDLMDEVAFEGGGVGRSASRSTMTKTYSRSVMDS